MLYKFYYVTFGKSKHEIKFHTRHANVPHKTNEARQLKKLFDVKAIASYGWVKIEDNV